METKRNEGRSAMEGKGNGGSEHDKWRNPMEGESAMEWECSQREKRIEGGSMMEGGEKGTREG